MEMNVLENVVVSEVAIQREKDSLRELSDLQLALVGGGIADVVAG
jgi:hypothetical protein